MVEMETVNYYECAGCGRILSTAFGTVKSVRTLSFSRLVVATVECENCRVMVAQNSNWLAGSQK